MYTVNRSLTKSSGKDIPETLYFMLRSWLKIFCEAGRGGVEGLQLVSTPGTGRLVCRWFDSRKP